MIVENTSFQFFRLCASFRNFHLVEGYPFAFINDFGFKNVVLQAETFFAIMIMDGHLNTSTVFVSDVQVHFSDLCNYF